MHFEWMIKQVIVMRGDVMPMTEAELEQLVLALSCGTVWEKRGYEGVYAKAVGQYEAMCALHSDKYSHYWD